jgi:hypothetical protein
VIWGKRYKIYRFLNLDFDFFVVEVLILKILLKSISNYEKE